MALIWGKRVIDVLVDPQPFSEPMKPLNNHQCDLEVIAWLTYWLNQC